MIGRKRLVKYFEIALSLGRNLDVVGLDLSRLRRPWLEGDWPVREHLPIAGDDLED